MDFPRTLLLTAWRQDARYAGAEAVRRILSRLPNKSISWCSLGRMQSEERVDLPRCAAFVPVRLHWRLQNSFMEYIWIHDVQSYRLAKRIATWVADCPPQIIWVLPELAAVPVAMHLRRLLDVPLHATLYDAPESARQICVPALYYPQYIYRMKRFLGSVSSVDAVSEELLLHVRKEYGMPENRTGISIPPSIPSNWSHNPPESSLNVVPKGTLRIGFCGAFRISALQWEEFLNCLGSIRHEFEIIAFAAKDSVPSANLPSNVKFLPQEYVRSERVMIDTLVRMGVCACYLGLWREPTRSLFCSTSLSSKLTSYAAAGVPIIVDAPENSAAWRLVKSYGAGILLPKDPDMRRSQMMKFFADSHDWHDMAKGAATMCREMFNLDANVERLAEVMRSDCVPGSCR